MAKIDEKLLEVLVCPVSKKSLVLNEENKLAHKLQYYEYE